MEESSSSNSNTPNNSTDMRKRKRRKITDFFPPTFAPRDRPSIRSTLQSKKATHNVDMAIARWWYDAGIPFNAAQSYYFQPIIDAIASYGSGYKAPSMNDYRGCLLSSSITDIKNYLNERRKTWATYGCSIICDEWTNRRQESIMNFFVYSAQETAFLKSIHASDIVRNANTLFEIFDEIVNEVGLDNIVQFITDNDVVYKVAGKRLQSRYNSFYWTSCAAYCIDSMLEDIGDARYFPVIDETLQKARKVTKFIYNDAWVLNLMRKEFTHGKNLCRPAITRFAANILSLKYFVQMKKELRQMFTSDKWVTSHHAKSNGGLEVARIILEDHEFWPQCQFVIRIYEPLVRVLYLSDSNKKETMGYFYDAMERAKEAIKVNLKNMSSLFTPYLTIINERWERQLESPLFTAGAFLNPSVYFRLDFSKKAKVQRGMLLSIITIVRQEKIQDLISSQMEEYKDACGDFGMPIAIHQRDKLHPVDWWDQFGSGVLELQGFAIRILSQCVSATGYERNWNIFEFIHSKRRNRLEHQRLNDLVFVRYNLKFQERNLNKTNSFIDPICLEHIDVLSEWVSEEPSFMDESDLKDNLGWKSIDMSFGALNLNDDDDDDEISLNDEDFVPNENWGQCDLSGYIVE